MSRRWVEQRGAMRNGPFTCFKCECACNPTYVRCDSNNLWRCPRCANLSIWYECASLPYVLAGGYIKFWRIKKKKKYGSLCLDLQSAHTLLWCYCYCDILGPLYTSPTSTDLNGTCYLLISRGAGWLVGCFFFSLGKARQPVAKLR